MKTIFTLFASLILSIAVFAADARPTSVLTIRSLQNTNISVVIDGRRFEPGFASMMIRELEPGRHQVKVYSQRSSSRFGSMNRRYELIYSTTLQVRPKTHIRITVDQFGRTSIDERKVNKNSDRRDRDNDDRNGRDNDWDRNQGRDNEWENDHRFDYGRDGKMGDYDTNYGFEKGMDDREFSRILSSIDKEWLETNKLKSATQVVRTSNLTSAQVKEIVLLFSFENNKLEVAKQAYQNTVDKRNFSMINDAFSFNSSREELARYIRNVR